VPVPDLAGLAMRGGHRAPLAPFGSCL